MRDFITRDNQTIAEKKSVNERVYPRDKQTKEKWNEGLQ
jgi:hypothetical protein